MTADYYDQAAQDDLWRSLQAPVEEGRRLRDQGVRTAEHGLDTRWRVAAEAVIAQLAATRQPFTSDHVTARVGPALGSATGGMGAVIRGAATRGLIRAAGYVTSSRPEAHGRPIRQWVGTGKTPEPAKPRKPPPLPRPAEPAPAPTGKWTAADTPQPCVRCDKPAFMRGPDGYPRHRADCTGAAS